MHYRIKKFLRYMLIFAAWVFFLSIRIGDQTLFSHAHNLLVDNRIVAAVDAEVTDLWDRISMTAKTAYGRVTPALPATLEVPSAGDMMDAQHNKPVGTVSPIGKVASPQQRRQQQEGKTDIALPHIPASEQPQAKG